LFDSFGELIEISSRIDVCRDPKDNFLLALAKDGRADYLITGDADLLSLNAFDGATILTYAGFERRVG
jgi:putative PIN family toxin of toxin-antitoxin system